MNYVNIIDIHNEITKYLIRERDIYQEYYNKKIIELNKIKKINTREEKYVDIKIKEINKTLEFKQNRVQKYNDDVKNIIEEYLKKIRTIEMGFKIPFEIKSLINEYILKASNYKLINQSKQKKNNVCPQCNDELDIKNNNFYHCKKCDIIFECMDTDIHFDKNMIIRRKGFINSLLCIQGKEHDVPPIDTFEKIKQYLEDKCIKLKKKKDIKDILKILKLTKYKSHSNYIFNYFTGKSLLNLSDEIQDRIINKYDLFIQEYDILVKERINSIKNQHLLYYLLKTEDIKLNEDDFDLIKTRDSEIECNGIITKIFNQLKIDSKMNWTILINKVN